MQYSGFWRRFAAYFIDGLILIVPSLAVGRTSIFFGSGFSFIVGILYFPVFECSVMCGTPGKALMGMAVLTESGERLSPKKAFLRFLCRIISVLTLYIGYLMQPFTQKRQTLHDMITETVVIDRQSEDLNYFRVWLDQFKEIINNF